MKCRFFVLALSLVSACAEEGPTAPGLACPMGITSVPMEPAVHVAQGSAIPWGSNPPATGNHYPVWAPWGQSQNGVVPRGNWVHNLEHGGVALLYRCPKGCPEVVARLSTLARSLPQDPLCTPPINARWLLTEDPLLPANVQVGAAAWGSIFCAGEFGAKEEADLRTFIGERYNRAPEDTCAEGAVNWMK